MLFFWLSSAMREARACRSESSAQRRRRRRRRDRDDKGARLNFNPSGAFLFDGQPLFLPPVQVGRDREQRSQSGEDLSALISALGFE